MSEDLGNRPKLLTGALALAIAGPVGGAANFVFHAIAAHALGPDAYGALTSLLVLTISIAVPAAAIQMSLARSLLSGTASLVALMRWAVRGSLFVAIGVTVTSPAVAMALHLDGPGPVLALLGYLVATVVGVVPKAVLVAEERLVSLAATTIGGVAIRLGVGYLWLANGGGLVAAILAGSVAEIVVTLTLCRLVRGDLRAVTNDVESDPDRAVAAGAVSWRVLLGPVVGFGALWCFLAVDTISARMFMDPEVAGSFAAVGVLARAALFVPQSIATASFARLADPTTRPRTLAWATAASLTMAVMTVAGLAVVGSRAFTTVFGEDFTFDLRVLVVLGAAISLVSVANIWLHARVAYGQATGVRSVAMLSIATVGAAPAADAGPLPLAWWMVVAAGAGLWLLRPASAVGAPYPDPAQVLADDPDGAVVDVSVVLPAYEVADVIAAHLLATERALDRLGLAFEIIVVDDGSSDDTAFVAETVAGPSTTVVRATHRGKGGALTTGFAAARGRMIGFVDADGDIPAAALADLVSVVESTEVDGAIAVKADTATRGLFRHVASVGYRRLVNALMAVGVSETQTGAKVYRREVVAAVLPWLREQGFAWDAEFLATAHHFGYHDVAEVPVDIGTSDSSIRPRTVWNMLRATGRIATRTSMLPAYRADRPNRTQTEPGPGEVRAALDTGADPDGSVAGLRILFLNWKCRRHPRAGGAETFTHEVCERWVAAGHHVTLFTSRVAGAPSEEWMNGVRVVRRGSRMSLYSQARKFWAEEHGSFDVVVDEVNTRPFEAPLWADVPVVALIHQLARDVWFRELPFTVAVAGRFMLEPTWLRTYRDVPVASISHSSCESLREMGLSRVIDVGVGFDLPADLPAPDKGEEPTVAFVGRMVSAKRPLDAIEAFGRARSELGAGRMYVMGDGPISDEVAAAASATPGVTYLGRVSEAEKFEMLARCHVIVATSVREGWGLVVDEGAAVGAHPIGYRVPGLADSIPAAGGTLVDADPRSLADALVCLLPRLIERPAAPRNGGAVSWDEVADRLFALVADAMNARPPALRGAR